MEQILIGLNDLSYKYSYRIYEQFGRMYIETKFEKWYLEINQRGIVTLYHRNTLSKNCNQYHRQFKRKITAIDLIEYLHNHETFRYAAALCLPY